MKVGIEIITGRFFYVEVGEEETVGGLKKEIAKADQEKPVEERMLLMHRDGRLLRDDDSALKSYGCCDGSIVYLFFHPPLRASTTAADADAEQPWPLQIPFDDRFTLHIKEGP